MSKYEFQRRPSVMINHGRNMKFFCAATRYANYHQHDTKKPNYQMITLSCLRYKNTPTKKQGTAPRTCSEATKATVPNANTNQTAQNDCAKMLLKLPVPLKNAPTRVVPNSQTGTNHRINSNRSIAGT